MLPFKNPIKPNKPINIQHTKSVPYSSTASTPYRPSLLPNTTSFTVHLRGGEERKKESIHTCVLAHTAHGTRHAAHNTHHKARRRRRDIHLPSFLFSSTYVPAFTASATPRAALATTRLRVKKTVEMVDMHSCSSTEEPTAAVLPSTAPPLYLIKRV